MKLLNKLAGFAAASKMPWKKYSEIIVREEKLEKLISPLPRGGRRISSSAFLSRRPFGYYLPIASYGTIFAAKWSSNGGLEAVVSK